MGCKRPIQATRNGAGPIRLLPRFVTGMGLASRKAWGDTIVELPCGRCAQCRVDKANDWATRCHHESKMHRHPDGSPNACMITLTFENEGLLLRELKQGTHPSSLDVRDWKLFAKKLGQHRLRKQRREEKSLGLEKGPRRGFRYFHVGEYGGENKRPHYHALLFGEDFSEDRIWTKDERGNACATSATLDKLWGYGRTDIRPMTPETVNYCCRYVTKKLNGEMLKNSLERLDPDTGEIITVRPEYATMSLKPGIGATWYERFKDDVFPDNFVVVKGTKKKVPRFYLRRLQKEDKELYERVADAAHKSAAGRVQEQTPERRLVRERVLRSKQKLYAKRKLD